MAHAEIELWWKYERLTRSTHLLDAMMGISTNLGIEIKTWRRKAFQPCRKSVRSIKHLSTRPVYNRTVYHALDGSMDEASVF